MSQLDDDEMDWVGSDELTEQPSPERVAPAPDAQEPTCPSCGHVHAPGRKCNTALINHGFFCSCTSRRPRRPAQEPASAQPHRGLTLPADRRQAIEKAAAMDDSCISAGVPASAKPPGAAGDARGPFAANVLDSEIENAVDRIVARAELLAQENATLRAALASAQQERDEARSYSDGFERTCHALEAERDSAQAQIAALTRQLAAVDAAIGFPDGNGTGRIEMIAALTVRAEGAETALVAFEFAGRELEAVRTALTARAEQAERREGELRKVAYEFYMRGKHHNAPWPVEQRMRAALGMESDDELASTPAADTPTPQEPRDGRTA